MTAIALTLNLGGFVKSPSDFDVLRADNPHVYIEPIGSAQAIVILKSEIESGREILLCDSRLPNERTLHPLPDKWVPNPSLV